MSTKKKTKARKRAGKRRLKGLLIPAVGALLVIGAATGYYAFARQPTPAQIQVAVENCSLEGVQRAEKRSPLSPSLFKGRAHMAYAVAMEMPEVLDQLYCYCRCQENHGHKSLLSCYADTHAANCNVCMDEAWMAARMAVKGSCPAEIQKAIDQRFGSG